MIGKYATSKAGHDKDKLYVIVAVDNTNVWLADGEYKKMDAPKKKNIRHIQIINETVEADLLTQINNRQPHIDDAIKYAIKQKLNSKKTEECNV